MTIECSAQAPAFTPVIAHQLVRYRYRVYPPPSQEQALARSFGCARRVYNDVLNVRDDARRDGVKLSDTEVQRRVITEAKRTEQRAWLAEASSVVLVQSVQDARRAYRNWFDSMSGKRKGRKMGSPQRKSKRDSQQSIRLTRNGFALRPNGRLYIAKVGELRVEWSRELPSVPSSVTVIREADGRYYASFVVDRDTAPLPESPHDVGIDLGLDRLATVSDGLVVPNARRLRGKTRALRRAQRTLSRRQGPDKRAGRTRGSKNWNKARRKVAAAHRKVREARLDAHHKLALQIVRDNQAIYLETLNVAGLGRSNLAKSVYDAGWSTLVRLIKEKAECHGRTVVQTDPWFPSSQPCSACGHRDGPKPLKVRSWTCPDCGAVHDRDLNAAINIRDEGRRTAAGLAVDASWRRCKTGTVPAVADEAGTHLGGAA